MKYSLLHHKYTPTLLHQEDLSSLLARSLVDTHAQIGCSQQKPSVRTWRFWNEPILWNPIKAFLRSGPLGYECWCNSFCAFANGPCRPELVGLEDQYTTMPWFEIPVHARGLFSGPSMSCGARQGSCKTFEPWRTNNFCLNQGHLGLSLFMWVMAWANFENLLTANVLELGVKSNAFSFQSLSRSLSRKVSNLAPKIRTDICGCRQSGKICVFFDHLLVELILINWPRGVAAVNGECISHQ